VRTIVEAAGGHIDATSTPGQGSCFTVTLRRLEPSLLPAG
jgi:signal transduction histidine kinase